ncbi:MAG: hypothetical protein Q9227_008598 [Pyrenula ochraceoflavens]
MEPIANHCEIHAAKRSIPSSALFSAANYENDGKCHILLASSGSVATIKLPLITKSLASLPHVSIRIVITASAENFLLGQSEEQPELSTLLDINDVEGIHRDEDEWIKPWVRGDKILHIELRRWAHVMVVAPLSANTLAKVTTGMTDNLLTSVIRAWEIPGIFDVTSNDPGKRIFVAPAMNTAMWRHPVTRKHIDQLEKDWKDWVTVLKPIEKELACGDTGDGAMMSWDIIVQIVTSHIQQRSEEIGNTAWQNSWST